MNFLTPTLMSGGDWRGLERAVARVLSHCGWSDVNVIGETGDGGADVLGFRRDGKKHNATVVQVKAVTGGRYVGPEAVDEAVAALTTYKAQQAVVATNGHFWQSTIKRASELRSRGFPVNVWNGAFLNALLSKWPEVSHERKSPRAYQQDVVDALLEGFRGGQRRMHFVLATGLGKSVVAATFLDELARLGLRRSLVLCHVQDLALQLERSFWSQLLKSTPTRTFFEGEAPIPMEGVNFGLFQSLSNRLNSLNPGDFDAVIVDEAHHAPAVSFRACLEYLQPKVLVGMTATPWRGDGQELSGVFGRKVAEMSLVEGMARGFLAAVNYKVYCDNIDWDGVHRMTGGRFTIRDLNKRLFLPQRDQAIAQEVVKIASRTRNPRIIVFCPSIEHGERFAEFLSSSGLSTRALSGQSRVNRYRGLMDFASGKARAVTAVNLLNEGIDVPAVNIVVFLRCTHSRTIFIQQLGRGLRLHEGKTSVQVMDFVADIRRLADVFDMDRDRRRRADLAREVSIPQSQVTFTDEKVVPFVQRWLDEANDLGTADDRQEFYFPPLYAAANT